MMPTTERTNTDITKEKNRTMNWVAPPVDIYENGEEFVILADIPGAAKDSIHVRYDRGQLDIEAHAQSDPRVETRVRGSDLSADYRRSFALPGTIDVNRISADLKNGVLTVHLPKAEGAKPRQIPIRVG